MDYRRAHIFSFRFSYHTLFLSLSPLNPDSRDPVRRYHLYVYLFMYVCMYINVYIRLRFGGLASGFALGQHSRPLCTHTNTYTLKRTLTCASFTIYNIYIYTYIQICVYIIICVHERVRVCICMYKCVNLCARVYLRTRIIYMHTVHMYM
jgi:hypothetical protein